VSALASAPPRQDPIGEWIAATPFWIGEILGNRTSVGAFMLRHRDDAGRAGLTPLSDPENAAEIARYDDAGKYRPLKTAPTLRHGWKLELASTAEVRLALDLFYPGRLAAYVAARQQLLVATPLRATLERQTGMYRVTAKITDGEADKLVASMCRSDGGCLRTICWTRDAAGSPASALLPMVKFDPAFDQTARGEAALPLLCQEACALLIGAARNVVKRAGAE